MFAWTYSPKYTQSPLGPVRPNTLCESRSMIFSMSSFCTMICCTAIVSLTTTANLSPVNANSTSIAKVGENEFFSDLARARRVILDLGLDRVYRLRGTGSSFATSTLRMPRQRRDTGATTEGAGGCGVQGRHARHMTSIGFFELMRRATQKSRPKFIQPRLNSSRITHHCLARGRPKCPSPSGSRWCARRT